MSDSNRALSVMDFEAHHRKYGSTVKQHRDYVARYAKKHGLKILIGTMGAGSVSTGRGFKRDYKVWLVLLTAGDWPRQPRGGDGRTHTVLAISYSFPAMSTGPRSRYAEYLDELKSDWPTATVLD